MIFQSSKRLKVVLANGIVMALYIALTLLVTPIASGMIQLRISESLNHLVVFNRKLMWGVLGGVIFYNLFYGFGVLDVIYGGSQTFLALGLTALLQKKVKSIPLRMFLNILFFSASMFLIAMMLVSTEGGAFWGMYGWLALSEAIIMTITAPVMNAINKKIHLDQRF